MVTILLFVAQAVAVSDYSQTNTVKKISDYIIEKQDKQTNETNIIELTGSIDANLYGEKFVVVYPTINMSTSQMLNINTTEVNGSYEVNATLRIRIKTPDTTNQSFLLKRYITVFATVMRKNQPLISGLLRDLFLGKSLTRINIFEQNYTVLYVDVPLKYETKQQDEEQRIFILAIGNVVGFFLKSPPTIALQTVDLTCHYSAVTEDTIPPLTDLILTGNFYEGVYLTQVQVSFKASDELSTVAYTTYRYTYSYNDMVVQSRWLTYTEPFLFESPGQYDIEYYSADSVGNIESTQATSFYIR